MHNLKPHKYLHMHTKLITLFEATGACDVVILQFVL